MRTGVILAAVLLGAAPQTGSSDMSSDPVVLAQRYFQAVWCGNPSALDVLASPDLVISYPLFQDVLGVPAVQGRDAAQAFVTRFAERWKSPEVRFHDSVSEQDRVVLVWSFSARPAGPAAPGNAAPAERRAWGGITLIRFDAEGRVRAEIGEESTPGPTGRSPAPGASDAPDGQAAGGREISGTLTPAGPPLAPPTRVESGGACVVDLRQAYRVSGESLSGSFEMDYRILVHGPCEEPPVPGKYDEEWIAHGTFTGRARGAPASATLIYTARVRAGGDVKGHMVLAGEVAGELAVSGNFKDGQLSYHGRVE